MAVEAQNIGVRGAKIGVGSREISAELAALAQRVSPGVVIVRVSPAGMGSGVVWDHQGLIITNAHVATRPEADVITSAGKILRARTVARVERWDLAALRVSESDGSELIPVEIGDSAAMRVGELVVAIGNPQGERNVATLGLLAGTGIVTSPNGDYEALRLAITLRPGNSGGTLVDAHGRVVGIPNMVIGAGLALAVPSRIIQQFVRQIAE